MLKTFYYLIFALGLTLFASCGDDENPVDSSTEVNLTFKLEYQGQPIHAFQELDYPRGYKLFLTKFSMFFTEAKLSSGTNSIDLFDAVFVDLLDDNNDPAAAEKGVTVNLTGVTAGNFDQLSLNLGVPAEDNAKKPSDFPNDSALANTGEYWVGWSSYIFHKIEGKIDPDGDDEFDTNVALHIGSDAAFRQRTFSKDINIVEGQTNEIELTIDLAEVLDMNGEYFDLIERPQVHNEGQLVEVLPLMDNLLSAIK